ncbi:Pol [Symbiodinium sp. CCMP2592]|nr:Pol [Symbiodinium sp. CCMP2592]
MPPTVVGDPAAVLNRVLHQAWQQIRPKTARPSQTSSPDTLCLIRQLWDLRRAQAQPPRTYSVLRGWLQAARLQRVQRLLRKACAAKKCARVDALLIEAESSKQPSALFSVVRRLACKVRTMRIQLRDNEGRLLAGLEEAEQIADFLRQVYGSQHIRKAPCHPEFQPVQFDDPDLLRALIQLGNTKALPSSFAPARLWKLAPSQVVQALLPTINLASSSNMDASWHEVQLYLIPKVQIVKEPKNLRPIALLHPGNKLWAAMLATRLKDKVAMYLQDVPQWAYLASRSTADALIAVCSHLHQVRELLADANKSHPHRFRGAAQPNMVGGISISLDVKKAFDSLRHDFLADAMREAEFTESEVQTVLFLHSQACLRVGSSEHATSVFLNTGIRQGCSLSPILWALATGRFYRMLMQSFREHGMPTGTVNLFADDVFGSWKFHSPEDFKLSVRALGILVSTLQKIGLELSKEKTVILLAAAGTSAPSVLSRYKTVIDQVVHMKIPVGRTRIAFRIVASHKYLGAHISYQGFELLNLKHRLQVTWGSFWRLHHILINRKLSLSTRVRLWQVCVFSVLRYSLHSVGLPPQGSTMIKQAVNRQLRLIARSPAHLWHIPSDDILTRLKVEDPWAMLCRQFPAADTRPGLLGRGTGVLAWLRSLQRTVESTHIVHYSVRSVDSPSTLLEHFVAIRHCNRECTTWDDLKVHVFTSTYWMTKLQGLTAFTWEELTTYLRRTKKDASLTMDLEGVSRDDLMQAAAELQHLQTMALQGEDFANTHQPPRRLQQPMGSTRLPPTPEVFTFTNEQEEEEKPQQKYNRPNGKGLDQGKGQPPTTRGSGRRPLFSPPQGGQAAPQRGQRRPYPTGAPQPPHNSGSALSTSSSANLVASVARLLLRHEGLLTGLAQNTTWIMFQGTAPPLTPVPAQMRIGEQWQLTKQESPAPLKHPLRTVLFQTWLTELKQRVEELSTDPARRQEALRLQALSEHDTFHYKKWNSNLRALESVTDRVPLKVDEVLGLINEAIVLSTLEDALINYNPTKQLLPDMTGPTVTFSLVVGLRDPRAFRLWTVIEALSGSGALMLVATTLRRERRSRSQLAQAVAQDLRRLTLGSTALS